MAKAFYFRLACSNLKRNRKTYYPYILTTAVISGVFLLIGGLLFSKSLSNLPTGKTASMLFSLGIVVFALFAFFFMVYINNFIVGRRKREFGLYGILGLEKRHVARILVWESLITLCAGVLCGAVCALVFGRLLFLLLLKLIHAAPNSVFSISPMAYGLTAGLFFAVFVVTSVLNRRQVRLASPMELMSSEKRGEKDSVLMYPLAMVGLGLLIAAYYYAWTTIVPGVALMIFFLLAILVIIATNILFTSGSIAALKALRANRGIYYKQRNFIAIGGMFQRMRQNAKSLATICILSTMLIVTVSGSLALYLGREQMYAGMYPFNVCINVGKDPSVQNILEYEDGLLQLAAKHNVVLSADKNKLTYDRPTDDQPIRHNYVEKGSTFVDTKKLICFDGTLVFDADGTEENCLAFIADARTLYKSTFPETQRLMISDMFTAREDGYGFYGGLLFLGAFFGLLFLAVTVLIIYFKQISEGVEDKAQFMILQKVGMDDTQVKAAINRQVLLVFFIPLGMTLLHMVFASKIMARMLQSFMLYDWGLVLACIGGVCVVFALLYLTVYLLTSRVYYRIVKW